MDSAEYTGALDLIRMSQEILRQELRGIRALRNFEAQFNEAEKKIDKKLHDDFVRYIINELSRDFSLGDSLVNEVKFELINECTRNLISSFKKGKTDISNAWYITASVDEVC